LFVPNLYSHWETSASCIDKVFIADAPRSAML
jgi:hypothetical protein